jgi:hypothetical protein
MKNNNATNVTQQYSYLLKEFINSCTIESKVTAFDLKKAANLTLLDYVNKIYSNFELEESIVVYSFELIKRYLKMSESSLSQSNIYLIMLISIIISCKMLQDEIFSQYDYSRMSGISLKKLNSLEYEFLEKINYNSHVPPELYSDYKCLFA